MINAAFTNDSGQCQSPGVLPRRRWSSWCRALLMASMLGLVGAAPAARADTVDTILGYLVQAGVIDGAIKDAKPLIECLVKNNGNPLACVDVQSLAEKEGKAAAAKFVPDDPKIQGVVELLRAVNQGDWVRVIDVAGMKVLLPLACDLGLATVGPLKGFVCKDALKQIVTKVAEPAVRGILAALATGKPEVIIWKVISLAADVDLACALVPDFPGKDIPCGALGKALAELGGAFADAAKFGGKIVVSGADLAENALFGDDSHMPYGKYYAMYFLPWQQKAISLCLTQQCQGLGGIEKRVWEPCVEYFDSHNQYKSTAQKTCDDLRDKRFDPDVKALSKAMIGQGEASAAALRPFARKWAVDDYGKDTLALHKSFFASNCEVNERKNFPLLEPDPARCEAIKKSPFYAKPGPLGENFKPLFDKMYQACVSDLKQQVTAPSPWATACRLAEPAFVTVVNEEQAALQAQLGKIVAAGCAMPNGWTAGSGLKFQCHNYVALAVCHSILKAGAEQQHCAVDTAKAEANLGKQIVAALGAKRCHVQAGAVVCTRPWKFDACKTQLALAAKDYDVKPLLKCSADLAGYLILKQQAQSLVTTLNAGSANACTLQVQAPAIACPNHQTPAASKISECAPDPNHDGADAPCLIQTLSADGGPQSAVGQPVPPAGMIRSPLPPAGTPAGGAWAVPLPLPNLPAVQSPGRAPAPRQILPQRAPSVSSPAISRERAPTGSPGTRGAPVPTIVAPLPSLREPPAASAPERAGAARAPTRSTAPLDGSTGSTAIERALAAAGCTPLPGAAGPGLHYSCPNRASYQRCEALRSRREVAQCTLNGQH